MPEYIYSKVDTTVLLHIVNRKADITPARQDLSPHQEFLQVSTFSLPLNKTFKAHKHLSQHRQTNITQESWIVIQGRVQAILYDLDDTIVAEPVLLPGDCSITFRGAHNYISLENDSLVYEYKTGPYTGHENDKTFI